MLAGATSTQPGLAVRVEKFHINSIIYSRRPVCYEHFLLNYLKGQLALMLDNLDDEHTKRPN